MTGTKTHALTEEQAMYVAGLVDLAGWLSQNPDAIPLYGQRILNSLLTNTAVEDFAARHGLDVTYDDEGNASVELMFGSIPFHVYGYVDFQSHRERLRREDAEEFAAEHDLTLVPVDGDGGAR